jgi:hypothetical protein
MYNFLILKILILEEVKACACLCGKVCFDNYANKFLIMASSYDVQKVTINDHIVHTWRVKLKFFILEKYFGDQDKKNNYVYENHENRLQSY